MTNGKPFEIVLTRKLIELEAQGDSKLLLLSTEVKTFSGERKQTNVRTEVILEATGEFESNGVLERKTFRMILTTAQAADLSKSAFSLADFVSGNFRIIAQGADVQQSVVPNISFGITKSEKDGSSDYCALDIVGFGKARLIFEDKHALSTLSDKLASFRTS